MLPTTPCAGEFRERKQRKREQTDSVDRLAKQYRDKIFGDGPAGKGGKGGNAAKSPGASQRAAMKRWFD